MTIHSTSAQDISSPFREHIANASPFSKVARSLYDRGYQPLPLKPREKCPGEYRGVVNGWRAMGGWTAIEITETRLDMWARWPDANVGVRCSEEFGAVDFDHGDSGLSDKLRARLAELPGTVVRRRGAKGWLQPVRLSGVDIEQIKHPGTREVLFEILAKGRQFVCPPSRHPDGMDYVWLTPDTLLDTDASELPLVDAAVLADLYQITADHLGVTVDDLRNAGKYERARPPREGGGGGEGGGGDDAHPYTVLIREKIGHNPDAWFPDLGLPKTRPFEDGFQAVASWRPNAKGKSDRERDPAFKWFGGFGYDYSADESYDAPDLVMATTGKGYDAAMRWLWSRVGRDDLVELHTDTEARSIALHERLTAANDNPAPQQNEEAPADQEIPDMPAAADNVIEFPEAAQPEADSIVPPHIRGRSVPWLGAESGLPGVFARWCYDAADVPQKKFATMAALALTSAIYGRKFLTPTGGGINLYMVGIGGSGYGKEFPLKAIGRAMHEHEGAALRHHGPGDFSSDAALYKVLDGKPSCVVALDEVGMFLGGAQARNASPHEQRIKKSLLELYASGSSFWTGRFTAAEKERATLYMPALTIAGMTTPTELTAAISEGNMTDGLLARFVFFKAEGRGGDEFNFDRIHGGVPTDVLEAIEQAFSELPAACDGGNVETEAYYIATMKPRVAMVPWEDDEAKSSWGEIFKWCRRLEAEERVPGGIINRAAENVLRIATVMALGRMGARAAVSEQDVLAAALIVFDGLQDILAEIEENHATSLPEAHRKAVLRVIRNPPRGKRATRGTILNNCKAMHGKEIDAALERLVTEGVIVREISSYNGKDTSRYAMS